MAALLATGTTAAQSADFTLAGESSTLFLVSTASVLPQSSCDIQIKGANLVYQTIGTLTTATPCLVLSAPGTYRVSRLAGPDVGVDRV
jgi:hypothetical protein